MAKRLLANLLFTWGVFSAALPGTAATAHAQQSSESTEQARAKFKEGVSRLKQEDWAGAELHLRDALDLRSSPVIRYNLALALSQRGKVVEALELLDHILSDETARAGLMKQAQVLRNDTEPRLARIELILKGNADGVTIALDGEELPPDAVDGPLASDAGSRVFVAYRDGERLTQASVTLTEGSTVSLDLNIPQQVRAEPVVVPTPIEAARAAPPSAQSDPAHTSDDSSGVLASPWFWVGTGAVVVGVAVTVVVLAVGGDDPAEPNTGTLGSIPIGE